VVVDCACGDGTCARLLAREAKKVYGFDLSRAAIESAQRASTGANLSFAVADGAALPLSADVADLYVSLETLEHLPDQDAFLREAVRVLRPSGELIISTPDRDVYSPGNTLESRPWNRFHVREFSQPELVSLLSRYFERIALFGQNAKSPTAVKLRVALARRLPRHTVVRLNQAAKLPRYLYDRPSHHELVPVATARRYELLTAVCRRPRQTR
jgi:ubiquinone/menaquinone biosynthesis C-methylase UbiE